MTREEIDEIRKAWSTSEHHSADAPQVIALCNALLAEMQERQRLSEFASKVVKEYLYAWDVGCEERNVSFNHDEDKIVIEARAMGVAV